MRLKRLEIHGFRGFENKVSVNFPANHHPAVFVGINGAGKTAVLESIVSCLQPLQSEMLGKRLPANLFKRYEVNNNVEERAICSLEWELEMDGLHEIQSGFEIRKTLDPPYTIFRKETKALVQSIKENIITNRKLNLPIVAYYPTERIVLNPSLKTQDISGITQLDAWVDAFESYINYDAFFQWFRNVEDLENEKRLNVEADFTLEPLQAVRVAIQSILNGFSQPRISRAFPADFIIKKENKILSLNQLSHGEKMTIAMVGDLARRLAIANPGMFNPLEGSGIVLIDEIDLHLHPRWQRSIVQKLRSTFPNIQFVLTTHSPLIINHLKPENIFLLEDGDISPLTDHEFNNYGADVEDTLKIIQKVESLLPEDLEKKLKHLFSLIDENKLEEAKLFKEQLTKILDAQHPEILKAETRIQVKELLN